MFAFLLASTTTLNFSCNDIVGMISRAKSTKNLSQETKQQIISEYRTLKPKGCKIE